MVGRRAALEGMFLGILFCIGGVLDLNISLLPIFSLWNIEF